MARQARRKTTHGTYHITQHGGGCRPLFTSTDDRQRFLAILERAKNKFGFRLFAYCLANDDSFHLVLYDNGCDISNIMRSINISYSMYAKCDGKLFKDRYSSLLLPTYAALLETTQSIHEGGQSSKWNSWCSQSEDASPLIDKTLFLHGKDQTLTLEALLSYTEASDQDQDECPRDQVICQTSTCMTTMEDAYKKLDIVAKEKGLTPQELLKDKDLRNKTIQSFRKNSTLSMKCLGEVFGGLSESAICRILNK